MRFSKALPSSMIETETIHHNGYRTVILIPAHLSIFPSSPLYKSRETLMDLSPSLNSPTHDQKIFMDRNLAKIVTRDKLTKPLTP